MDTGELSTLLAWGSTAAYVVALAAFGIDLARIADAVPARRRARVDAATAVPVAVGAAGPDGRPGRGPGGRSSSGTAVSESAGTQDVTPRSSRRAVGVAMATTLVGFVMHAVATVLRGIAAERVPWANMYEFALVGTLVAVGTFLLLCRWRDLRFLGAPVVGLSVIFLTVALQQFYVPAEPVEPALQSYWLVIHVSTATVATGLFTVSFVLSVMQLLRDSRVRAATQEPAGRLAGPHWRTLDALPSAGDLEAMAFRIAAVGFVLWTFILMTGAIWAEAAWGRYWGWDPKEVWSFVVWVVYAAYLHARTTRGWAGRRAAWFSVVGYATVIFNFTGVNLLFQGLHSYSGL